MNMVNKPSHYIGVNGLEVEEVLENFLPKIKDGYVAHRVGSAVEYLLRHPEKNGDEDILKAMQNIKQVVDYQERKLIGVEDLQRGIKGESIFEQMCEKAEDDEMDNFLKALANMKTQWTDFFVPSNGAGERQND